jgi:hypothetical protein
VQINDEGTGQRIGVPYTKKVFEEQKAQKMRGIVKDLDPHAIQVLYNPGQCPYFTAKYKLRYRQIQKRK